MYFGNCVLVLFFIVVMYLNVVIFFLGCFYNDLVGLVYLYKCMFGIVFLFLIYSGFNNFLL